MSIDLPAHPFAASVVYLQLRGWDDLPGREQAARRAQLETTVAALADVWPEDRRFVLEARDGVAIVGLGHPRAARRAARHAAGGAALAVGLHRGMVELAAGPDGTPRGSGEGLDTARQLAGLAAEGAVEESLEFRRALALAGRRIWLGVAGMAALLAAGVAVRAVRERRGAGRKPAAILLAIEPWGEVYVDGELKGTAPPLTRVWVEPGAHTVEIRHGRIKSLRLNLHLRPGEELELAHTFDGPPARRRAWWERFRFW